MSNEQPPGGLLRRGISTGRLEALSDGVYAIAITPLVLDIAVPANLVRPDLADEDVQLGDRAVLRHPVPPLEPAPPAPARAAATAASRADQQGESP